MHMPMPMPVSFKWQYKQHAPMPIAEFYAMVNSPIPLPTSFYFYIALELIDKIEAVGGSAVEPLSDIPTNKKIFFTARFNSNFALETFTKAYGIQRIG